MCDCVEFKWFVFYEMIKMIFVDMILFEWSGLRKKHWIIRSKFNRGSIEGEFNSHRIASGSEDLMNYLMELNDIKTYL